MVKQPSAVTVVNSSLLYVWIWFPGPLSALQKNLRYFYNTQANNPRMARKTTITSIKTAIGQIDKNNCDGAKTTLVALDKKLSGTGEKRPAGKYALFLKANYGKISKANPKLTAPDIMKKVAVEWNKQKAQTKK